MDKEINIAICIPTSGHLHWRFAADLMSLNLPFKTRVLWQVRTMIATARNTLVQQALSDPNCTHILMLDDDMTFDSELIVELIKRNVDIIGALAFKRTGNFEPCVFIASGDKFTPILPKIPVELDAIGSAGLMVKREVYEKIGHPYFETYYNVDGTVTGVDIDFSKKVKKAGFKIVCDPSILMGHIGEEPVITQETFLDNYNKRHEST